MSICRSTTPCRQTIARQARQMVRFVSVLHTVDRRSSGRSGRRRGHGIPDVDYSVGCQRQDNPSSELERVIVHEIGHQFWYGMVANNEFEEAWLDEGFTSYVEDKVMEERIGMVRSWPILSSYMTAPAPLKLNSWEYSTTMYTQKMFMREQV